MVDVFSYDAPDANHAPLGSLYVIGQRGSDDPSVNYIISLIAAMAHRHYFSDTTLTSKDAFSRTLQKLNEIVDDFVRVNNAPLSVGVVAVARGTLLASRVDKFKVLLARQGEIIDVFTNLTLFTKEHLEKKRFSSMLSGALEDNDALLAFVPTKAISTRERFVRTWLAQETPEGLTERLTAAGEKSPTFEATFLHVSIGQTAQPTVIESAPQPVAPVTPPIMQNVGDPALTPSLAWAPRQQQATPAAAPPIHVPTVHVASDVPRVIGSEFSLGTRRYGYERWIKLLRSVRLTTRMRAGAIGIGVLAIILGATSARSWWGSRSERLQYTQALEQISSNLSEATRLRDLNDRPGAQRQIASALSALSGIPSSLSQHQTLSIEATELLNSIDDAVNTSPTLFLQLDATSSPSVIVWSSASNTTWTFQGDNSATTARQYRADGSVAREEQLSDIAVSGARALQTSIIAWDNEHHEVVVIRPDTTLRLSVTDQDIHDVAFYGDNAYILTTTTILKISNIEDGSTLRPTPWLLDSELKERASTLWIDGSIFTISPTGTVHEYFKGAHRTTYTVDVWPLESQWLATSLQDRRVIIPSIERIVHYGEENAPQFTQNVESLSTLRAFTQGPDDSTLGLSSDNKIWKIE